MPGRKRTESSTPALKPGKTFSTAVVTALLASLMIKMGAKTAGLDFKLMEQLTCGLFTASAYDHQFRDIRKVAREIVEALGNGEDPEDVGGRLVVEKDKGSPASENSGSGSKSESSAGSPKKGSVARNSKGSEKRKFAKLEEDGDGNFEDEGEEEVKRRCVKKEEDVDTD